MTELLFASIFLFGMAAGAALMDFLLGPDRDLGRVRYHESWDTETRRARRWDR